MLSTFLPPLSMLCVLLATHLAAQQHLVVNPRWKAFPVAARCWLRRMLSLCLYWQNFQNEIKFSFVMLIHVMLNFVMISCVMIFWYLCDDDFIQPQRFCSFGSATNSFPKMRLLSKDWNCLSLSDHIRSQFHQHFTCTFLYKSELSGFPLVTFGFVIFLAQTYWHKRHAWNVDEIATRSCRSCRTNKPSN